MLFACSMLRPGCWLRAGLAALFLGSTALTYAADAPAPLDAPMARWHFQTSLYTKHFNPDPKHTNHQRLIGVERWSENNWLIGGAWFRNSFDQPSQYLYVGKVWRPLDSYPLVHLKLTGGLLHGYKGEFRDKIPFNGSGIAPALLPSIGLSGKRFTADLVIFGTAGAMLAVGVFWP